MLSETAEMLLPDSEVIRFAVKTVELAVDSYFSPKTFLFTSSLLCGVGTIRQLSFSIDASTSFPPTQLIFSMWI